MLLYSLNVQRLKVFFAGQSMIYATGVVNSGLNKIYIVLVVISSSGNFYCIESCSVFVKLYVNNSDDRATLERIDEAFQAAYTIGNPYVVSFLGRLAINVTATSPSMGRTLADRTVNDSVHPGCDSESCPEGDPTLLAVVIGTYVGTCIHVE